MAELMLPDLKSKAVKNQYAGLSRAALCYSGGFMLIDYIQTEKLPWIVVWLDWHFYAHWRALILCVALFIGHYWLRIECHSFSGVCLALFVGCCAWVTFCAVRYGHAVG